MIGMLPNVELCLHPKWLSKQQLHFPSSSHAYILMLYFAAGQLQTPWSNRQTVEDTVQHVSQRLGLVPYLHVLTSEALVHEFCSLCYCCRALGISLGCYFGLLLLQQKLLSIPAAFQVVQPPADCPPYA